MATHRLRSCLAPLALAILDLACSDTPDDRDDVGNGIHADVSASEQTRLATGVADWEVSDVADGRISVLARDAVGAIVVEIRGHHGATLGVEIGSSGHQLLIDATGKFVADDLNADELAVIDRFRIDAAAALADGGFRDEESCGAGGAAGGAGGSPGGGGAAPPGTEGGATQGA